MGQNGLRKDFAWAQASLLAIFALSGFTGLIYESIWSHYLKLFLGHAAYAQTLVLAIFMGGMAIGSALASRGSTRFKQPILAYAAVELLIGVLALSFDREFRAVIHWSFDLVIPALSSGASLQAFKWSVASLLLLPQSVLLGMTFPLIGAGLIRSNPGRSGELLGLLYFSNCLGATAGVLTSGFYLIAKFGLPGTILVAGALNLLVAFIAWVLSKRVDQHALTSAESATAGPARDVAWLIGAALVTGLASFLYEIAWIRMLSLVLGSATHSFELMLAAFIAGLAAGGLWIRRRIDGIGDPLQFLARILLAISALAALTVAGYYYTFDVIAWARNAFSSTDAGYVGFNLVGQALAMALMMPVTFLAGTTLPLITHILLRRGGGERSVGRVYAWNTFGCIAGAMLGVHWLLPAVGVKGTIITGAFVTLILAIAGLLKSDARLRPLATRTLAVGAIIVLCWVTLDVRPDPHRMLSAVYRTGRAEIGQGFNVIYLRDGKTATISLLERYGVTTIATNGKPDASVAVEGQPPTPDEITQVMLATLPLSLHRAPARIANIGFGSGMTSAVLLKSDTVRSLTSIEIEPFVVDAARQGFGQRVEGVFTDPRSRIVIEDAKSFFAGSHARFDIIVSEPSNPWVSGVATLFSDEFYGQITEYLADDGLLVQWLQIYETDIDVVVSILKALSPHFTDYQVFNAGDADILVVASRGRRLGDPDPKIFDNAALREALRRAGITGLEDLTSRRIGNKKLLDPFLRASRVPVNSDYFPYVDQSAAKFRFTNRDAYPLADMTMLPVPVLELAIPEWTTAPPGPPPEFGQGNREPLVSRAMVVASSLASGDLRHLPARLTTSVNMLHIDTEACKKPGNRRAWTMAVTDLSRQTMGFLPYENLIPMWHEIHSSMCYVSANAAERIWPDFLHAVSRRDRPEIVRLGVALLQRKLVGTRSDDAGIVLAAVAASLYGIGQPGEASAFLRAWAPMLGGRDPHFLALRILDAASAAG
jgi:spermidine synthase